MTVQGMTAQWGCSSSRPLALSTTPLRPGWRRHFPSFARHPFPLSLAKAQAKDSGEGKAAKGGGAGTKPAPQTSPSPDGSPPAAAQALQPPSGKPAGSAGRRKRSAKRSNNTDRQWIIPERPETKPERWITAAARQGTAQPGDDSTRYTLCTQWCCTAASQRPMHRTRPRPPRLPLPKTPNPDTAFRRLGRRRVRRRLPLSSLEGIAAPLPRMSPFLVERLAHDVTIAADALRRALEPREGQARGSSTLRVLALLQQGVRGRAAHLACGGVAMCMVMDGKDSPAAPALRGAGRRGRPFHLHGAVVPAALLAEACCAIRPRPSSPGRPRQPRSGAHHGGGHVTRRPGGRDVVEPRGMQPAPAGRPAQVMTYEPCTRSLQHHGRVWRVMLATRYIHSLFPN